MDEVSAFGSLAGAEIREAKEVLAFEATKVLHGEEEAVKAQEAARRLFAEGQASDEAVPATKIAETDLAAGIPAVELFHRAGLCKSRGAARRLIEQGGAYVNGSRVASVDTLVSAKDLQEGAILLRAGKKRHRRVVVS
jgi:tyrosyl-tRNA synthetase